MTKPTASHPLIAPEQRNSRGQISFGSLDSETALEAHLLALVGSRSQGHKQSSVQSLSSSQQSSRRLDIVAILDEAILISEKYGSEDS
jgi:hypothetical protein